MQRLEVIDQIVSCERCELHEQCKLPVPFNGPTPSEIAIVGAAPGGEEDARGVPFIGRAGQMIRKHLSAVDIDPDKVCWVNTVSCFTREPTSKHVEACADNKRAQLRLAEPKWILLLGKVALAGQLPDVQMKQIRGHAFKVDGVVNFVASDPLTAVVNEDHERALSEDIEQFKAMIDGDKWTRHVSDHCATCGAWAEWYRQDGIALCLKHAPDVARDRLRMIQGPKKKLEPKSDEPVRDRVWERRVWADLNAYLRSNSTMFVDDFWVTTERSLGIEALIPILKRAAEMKLMEKTDELRVSEANRGSTRPVWLSCIYQSQLV